MSARSLFASAVIVAGLVAPTSAAAPTLPRDGWASWDVPAIDKAPAWCCFGWDGHDSPPGTCKLDGHTGGFGSRDHETTNTLTVYARSSDGTVDRLQVLSASCRVETKTPIQELEGVSSDDSAHWLLAQVQTHRLTEDAMAGLAMHRGDFPRDSLIRIGAADASAELRAKAWFWLAMTGGPGAEAPITAAIRKDPDDHVREQAVFALSQLPDERAIPALIAIAEDRTLAREQRKRAVFWLTQSESPGALAYLDKVLSVTATR
jgi:hypothetical protein